MEPVLAAVGAGLGLASAAGVRASLPLVAALSIVIGANSGNPPISFMQMGAWLSLPVMVTLLLLVVLECALDKLAVLGRSLTRTMIPVRMLSGAVVFAIVIVDRDPPTFLGPMVTFYSVRLPGGLTALAPWLVAGAIVAGVVAAAKAMSRPRGCGGGCGKRSGIALRAVRATLARGGVAALLPSQKSYAQDDRIDLGSSRAIMLLVETFVWAGMAFGLASVAGLRAFLPLALFGLLARLGFVVPPDILGLSTGWAVVGIFAALAVVEIALDKVRALDPAFGYAMIPFRLAAGAALFATMISPGAVFEPAAVPELVAGAGVAALVAVLAVILRPGAGVGTAGVSTSFLSAIQDAVALVAGVLSFFVPYLPVLLVVFLLFFFNRIRKRRGRKFGGLRILGD